MHANGSHPAVHRRLGTGNQAQHGKEARHGPEPDPAHDREVPGPPEPAVAHLLGGRAALEGRCAVPSRVLVVQGGTWSDEEPGLDRIVARRQCMPLDSVGLLAPTARRGRLQRTGKGQVAQRALEQRRALFDSGADKGGLGYLRDNRLTLPLHGYSLPTPFVTTDWPVEK